MRDQVDEGLFLSLVRHIREHGYKGSFYHKPITYFDEDGMVYWTMGAPIEETTIVNRCTKEQSYEYKRDHGLLPENRLDRFIETEPEKYMTILSPAKQPVRRKEKRHGTANGKKEQEQF